MKIQKDKEIINIVDFYCPKLETLVVITSDKLIDFLNRYSRSRYLILYVVFFFFLYVCELNFFIVFSPCDFLSRGFALSRLWFALCANVTLPLIF